MPRGPVDMHLLFTLGEVQRLVRAYADKQAARYGITRAQWAVLAKVERTEGLTQTELAEQMEMQPSTLKRLIDSVGLADRLRLRLGGRGVVDRGGLEQRVRRGSGRRRAGKFGTLRRAQCLLLLARDLLGIRTPAALELEVLPDGVVEQSHLALKAYSALTVRFFPERFAR